MRTVHQYFLPTAFSLAVFFLHWAQPGAKYTNNSSLCPFASGELPFLVSLISIWIPVNNIQQKSLLSTSRRMFRGGLWPNSTINL